MISKVSQRHQRLGQLIYLYNESDEGLKSIFSSWGNPRGMMLHYMIDCWWADDRRNATTPFLEDFLNLKNVFPPLCHYFESALTGSKLCWVKRSGIPPFLIIVGLRGIVWWAQSLTACLSKMWPFRLWRGSESRICFPPNKKWGKSCFFFFLHQKMQDNYIWIHLKSFYK